MSDSLLAGFDLLKIPILDSGDCTWPERLPLSRISEIRLRVGEEKFASQMMLSPIERSGARFDAGLLEFYDWPIRRQEANGALSFSIGPYRISSGSCWWDPSYCKSGGDASVIAAAFADEAGRMFLHEVFYISVNAGEPSSRAQCRAVADFLARNFAPAVAVESNGLGKFLPEILAEEIDLRGLCIPVREAHSKTPKQVRIMDAFDASLPERRLFVSSSVKVTPWLAEFAEWEPYSTAHDDGVDAAAGALSGEFVRMPAFSPSRRHKDRQYCIKVFASIGRAERKGCN